MTQHFPTFAYFARRLWWRWRQLRGIGWGAKESTEGVRWTRSNKEAVLHLMAVAADQRIPLAPLLDAYALDAPARDRQRIRRLAERVREGTPLAESLEQNPRLATESTILAVRAGTQSGALGPALRAAMSDSAPDKDGQFHSDLMGNLIYVAVVLAAMSLVFTFMAVKIAPTFEQIMKDMSVEAPAPFRRSLAALSMLVQWWWLGALVLVAVVFLVLTGRLQRWVSRGWLGRLTQPWLGSQTADVLQNLSVVTQAGRPMAGAISTLARYHYCPSVRQRLLFVRNELEHGAGLWPSMQSARLVNARELRLLEAATRVGNVPWVLRQIARRRRLMTWQRRDFLIQMVFPLCILMLGGLVLWFGSAVFLPLVRIMSSIA